MKLMAGPCSLIGKRMALLWDKIPFVTAGMQGEQQDAEGIVVANLARLVGLPQLVVRFSSRSHDKRTHALFPIGKAARIQRGNSFVMLVVSGQHHIDAVPGQDFPEGAEMRLIAVVAGGIPGVVPIGQRAGRGIGFQIVAEQASWGDAASQDTNRQWSFVLRAIMCQALRL